MGRSSARELIDSMYPTSGYSPLDSQRVVAEAPKRAERNDFQRDRARVLHSAALRRLAAKTQVVMAGESDFPRTRLTHTLEVAQIARELGASLGCDPDVADLAGLAHDLGHPPFGHNGEDALDLAARDIGGFEGNAQSFRILARLESKVTDVRGRSVGLNLTRASLDGVLKYPWLRQPGVRKFNVYEDDIEVFDWVRQGAPETVRCFEAQVMDWSDDVAYSVHDVEDGVQSRHIDLRAIRSESDRNEVCTLAHEWYAPDHEPAELRAALDRIYALSYWPISFDGSPTDMSGLKNMTSELIGRFVNASVRSTRLVTGVVPLSRFQADLVIPADQRCEVAVLKALANLFVFQRPHADKIHADQRELITELVDALIDGGRDVFDPLFVPAFVEAPDDAGRMRVVVDQVASLTDRSVVQWHSRLCRP